MEYDFSYIDNILCTAKNKISETLDEFSEYISSIKELTKEYNIGSSANFNIFSSISDIYYRENFHSDIIKFILDPSTDKIGNSRNIQLFVELIAKIKPELSLELGNDVSVEREKGRIDILVYDEKNRAIIIENKIHNADDRDDQLGRYYNTVTKRGFEVIAIVYLTLTLDKIHNINYTIKDQELRKLLLDNNLIIQLPVINKENGISFSNDFIGECIKYSEYSKDKDIAKVYYLEYNELIKSLGGDAVTKDLYWKVIKDIYADKEKLEKFNIIGSLWDKHNDIINGIITELLIEKGFKSHPFIDPANTMSLMIDGEISLGYHLNDKSFGFVHTTGTKEFSNERQEELKAILGNVKLTDIFVKNSTGENTGHHGGWVWKDVDFDKIRDWKIIIDNFNILEELVKEYYKIK